jgi:hypothetical protein
MVFQNDINMLCAGCMLLRNNAKVKRFLKQILDNQHNFANDQINVNGILRAKRTDMIILVFPENNFPNGLLFFRNDYVPCTNEFHLQLRNKFYLAEKRICFVHANWMIGIDKKIQAFKDYGLWL